MNQTRTDSVPMNQTRTDSLMEALTNVAIGFSINFTANVIVLPLVLGVPVNFAELGLIGAIYTIISVARSYSLRRLFNGRSVWQAIKARFGSKPELALGHLSRALQARQSVEHLIERS